MKTRVIIITVLLLLFNGFAKSEEDHPGNISNPKDAFKIYVSPKMYNLMNNWVDHYSTNGQATSIEIISSDEKQINRLAETDEALCIVSDQDVSVYSASDSWKIVVAQDVVVPILNSSHPLKEQFLRTGISMNDFQDILRDAPSNWNKVLNIDTDCPLNLYVSSTPFVMTTLNKLAESGLSKKIKPVDETEIISKVLNDKFAIGFCNLSQLSDGSNLALLQNISILPVDKNGNRKLDYVENIYENLQTFQRGVWIGKYPNVLSSKIYAISKSKPANASEVAFLKWILSDGQKYLASSGFSDLVYAERLSQLSKFDSPDNLASVPVKSTSGIMSIFLIILVVFITIGIILDMVFRRARKPLKPKYILSTDSFFNQQSVTIPKGVYFDKTHAWVFMRRNGQVKIGIDDFMMHVTGEISKIDMKSSGTRIMKGEILFSIISKGRLLNFYSPISGTIVEHNVKLKSNPLLISSSPYSDGWIYNIQPLNWGLEMQYLSLAEKYAFWITNEFSRLKEFFTSALRNDSPELAHVVLQDGGSLKNNVLADMNPKIWEDFQTQFIDVSK